MSARSLEEDKIRQAKHRLIRIQDRWESGIYTEDEAVDKAKELRQTVAISNFLS
jgi:hypothetical protein